MIFQLDENIWFPDPHLAETEGEFGWEGMLAVGGDLSPERLKLAYSLGIFPWFNFRQRELTPVWYCPQTRFVIFPHEIHVSHSMRTLMNKRRYRLSMNENFVGVINNCSRLRIHMRGAWLGRKMVAAYTKLHEMGIAKSVEGWEKDDQAKNGERLVGGLYGVWTPNCFAGESMFSLVPSASKLALIHLARTLQSVEGAVIDCQFHTPHLESMGGRHISYDDMISHIIK